MQIVITPSDKPTKKFEARIDGKKSIHFGAKGMMRFYNTQRSYEKKQIS
jgi:hypothetical protein